MASELLLAVLRTLLPSYHSAICINKFCLIFQLFQASSIPKSLYKALDNPNIIFTGVKISGDAKKLEEDYGLEVACFADIAAMAAEEFGEKGFKRAGPKTLVETLTGEEIDKPKTGKSRISLVLKCSMLVLMRITPKGWRSG